MTYHDLLQVLFLYSLQGVNKVLFDVYVQGVLHICHLPHGLTHLHQSTACGDMDKQHIFILMERLLQDTILEQLVLDVEQQGR